MQEQGLVKIPKELMSVETPLAEVVESQGYTFIPSSGNDNQKRQEGVIRTNCRGEVHLIWSGCSDPTNRRNTRLLGQNRSCSTHHLLYDTQQFPARKPQGPRGAPARLARPARVACNWESPRKDVFRGITFTLSLCREYGTDGTS